MTPRRLLVFAGEPFVPPSKPWSTGSNNVRPARQGRLAQDEEVLGRKAKGQGKSEVMARDQSADAMLMSAMDATLNRLRVLAREMCWQDAAKLEAIVNRHSTTFQKSRRR